MSSPSPSKRQRVAPEHTCGATGNLTTRGELVTHFNDGFCGTLVGKLKCKACMAAWKEVGDVGELATLQFNRELAMEYRGEDVDQGAEYREAAKAAFYELLRMGALNPHVTSTLVQYKHVAGETTDMCEILAQLRLYTVLGLYMEHASWAKLKPSGISHVTNRVEACLEDFAQAVKLLVTHYDQDVQESYVAEYAEDHTCYPPPDTVGFYFFAYVDRYAEEPSGLLLARKPLKYGHADMVAAVGKELYDELFCDEGQLALRD